MPIKIRIDKSPRKEKKWTIKIDTPYRKRTLHIGDATRQDFTQHGDPRRKMSYILRHYPREDWEDPFTAGFWSRWMLWSLPDINDAIRFAYGKAMTILRNQEKPERIGRGKKQYKLLELFKGTGSVGKVANKMGMNVISLDNMKKYEPDILTDILDWDYKKFHGETGYIPDFIWASPPCNTFSTLAYAFKERDTKTAEPFSERAKIGTKILYKTLQIIQYFMKLNPNLLFVIENPRGMMRLDKKMKRLMRETTLYCLYGDEKRKPTDFFSNIQLDLEDPKQKCPNKPIPVKYFCLNQRYAIPSKLIKSILEQLINEYD